MNEPQRPGKPERSDEPERPGEPPPDVVALADARALARAERDWREADRLRALIESAGWKVADAGFSYRLEPAHPPTIEAGGIVRYGASADVPDRLDEAPVGTASVVLVATEVPDELARTLASLAEHAPDGCQVVVVGDAPSAEQEAALLALDARDPGAPGVATDVVLTSARLGRPAALNAGLRRAAAEVVVLLGTDVGLAGDALTPLVRALDEPAVAVCGAPGLVTADLRTFEPATGEVDVIAGACLAFRRSDYARRGPLDERIVVDRHLDAWWSLALRDEGEGRPPRRALALDGLPLVRPEPAGGVGGPHADRDRAWRRSFYRLHDRFGRRADLLAGSRTRPAAAGPGANRGRP